MISHAGDPFLMDTRSSKLGAVVMTYIRAIWSLEAVAMRLPSGDHHPSGVLVASQDSELGA
jgi:hypothetical protein